MTQKNTTSIMKEILKYLGNFGRYQAFLYALLFVPGFLGGATTLMYQWTGFSENSRCCIPELDGSDCSGPYEIPNVNMSRLFVAKNRCLRCDIGAEADCEMRTATNCRGHGTVYDIDNALIPNSVVIQFDLDCDRVWMKRMLWSLNTLGFLIGSALWSVLSDRFGRRRVFLLCAFLYILVVHLAVFAWDFYSFGVMQVLIGCINYGCFLTAYVVFMELVDGLPRTTCGIWYQGMFTMGMLYDGLCAYYVRDWRWLQWLCGAPTLLFLGFYWVFPESIRWLIVNEKQDEARKYIKRAAKCNKVSIPEDVLQSEMNQSEHHEQASLFDLFSNWRLAKNTSIVWFSWLATSMAFYGLAQNTSDLPGSPYWTYTLSALAELPAYVVAVPITEFWGRKPTLVLLFFLCGVSCIGAGLLRDIVADYLIVTLALIGKGCAAGAFAVIYNYAAEIFPTGDYVDPRVPIVIYGSFALMAAFLDLFLPETKGRELPETIEDGKYFGVKPVGWAKLEQEELERGKTQLNGQTKQSTDDAEKLTGT